MPRAIETLPSGTLEAKLILANTTIVDLNAKPLRDNLALETYHLLVAVVNEINARRHPDRAVNLHDLLNTVAKFS